MRSRAVYVFAVIVFLMAACGGPRTPLEVGVREFPTDVLFGRRETPPPPPPASNPNPGFPVLVSPVTPGISPLPSPRSTPASECEEAHPFTAPRHVAGTRSDKAPIVATYPFRNEGFSEQTRDGEKIVTNYPPESSRRITDVETESDGSFTYHVTDDLSGAGTRTRYQVVPESPLADQAGVFITRIESGVDFFTPQPKLKILQFPVENGFQWDAAGTDPFSQTTMSFHARIGREVPDGPDDGDEPDLVPKVRVDACGEVLDAWYVDITQGQVISPQTNFAFITSYAIGTQFGGLIVMEHTEASGTEGSVQFANNRTATISSEPALP